LPGTSRGGCDILPQESLDLIDLLFAVELTRRTGSRALQTRRVDMDLYCAVFIGDIATKDERDPLKQTWIMFRSVNVSLGHMSYPDPIEHKEEALKVLSLIRGRREISVACVFDNPGVDVWLLRWVNNLYVRHVKVNMIIELRDADDHDKTLAAATMFDIMVRNQIYVEDGYTYIFYVKGKIDYKEYE
jgi:hypothetical protein